MASNETHAEIVREMRGPYYKMGRSNASLDKQMMDYMSFIADRIEAAHKCEIAEMKHWIKSAARWIKCHDIYHTSGDDLIKQAKEILNDDGEFLFKKGEQ